MNKTIGAILAPLALAGAILFGVPASTSTTQPDVIVSGAVIRFGEDGPYWHTNSAHHAIGLIDTSTQPFINSDGWMEFPLTENGQPNPHAVVSMTVASDETLTAEGIFCGASSGTYEVRVRCSRAGVNGADTSPLNLNNATHYDRISGDFSNVWVTLIHHRDAG